MEQALVAVIALLLGALVAWVLLKSAHRKVSNELESVKRENQLKGEEIAGREATQKSLEARIEQITADRESLKESFGSLAADQLKANRDEFLKQAEERFGKSEQKQTGELEKRHEAIEKEFKGVNESLEKFKKLQDEYDSQRIKDFSALRQQMSQLGQQTEKLGESATGLSTALRGSSQSRGKWGEMALRNIVEAAGMTAHCDFIEQTTDDTGRRPDLVVKLPGEAGIPIDAKVPYADYDRGMEATDPEVRKGHIKKHGDTVRSTMLELAKRNYADEIDGEIDFTIMFIPIESVAAAAFAVRPDLQEEAIERRVLITTPVTLIALLRTVAIYWRQEKMAHNAREVWDQAQELHKRLLKFHGHLSGVGKGLQTAVKKFNEAVGSYESRVLPQGRKIQELSSKEGESLLGETSLLIEAHVTHTQAEPEEEI